MMFLDSSIMLTISENARLTFGSVGYSGAMWFIFIAQS